jgi:hypothetical protein
MFKKFVCALGMILVATLGYAGGMIHHKLSVTIDPAKHSLEAVDQISIPAATAKPTMSFLLNSNLRVLAETPGVTVTLDTTGIKAEDFGMDRENFNESGNRQSKYLVHFGSDLKGDAVLTISYSGVINTPIKQMGEEYARGFSQTPGIIDEKGTYLGGSTYWVPWFNGDWISFELTASMQEPWTVVSQGKRTVNELKNGVRTVTWDSPEPMEEVYLIGAKFTEYSRSAGATDVIAFLRTPDEALANKYLETTAQYLEMYRKLVGPYPFTKFALVENFWETGYGMPSFTLLGEQIIRFPFILHSSYPHELLHNYWGNSVYIDFKSGNWCEGLTAYMADHLISEQRGQGDEYRRTTLQKYTDYVNASNDFPLKSFGSRYNAPSEAIGYGKNMMVWNMLREEVGDELFVKGFQKFYRDNKFRAASYGDIRAAFESVSGKDLKAFFEQWVDRTGAPELSISNVSAKKEKAGYRLKFTLSQLQKEDLFVLNVPIAVSFASKVEMNKVAMSQKKQAFELVVAEEPLLVQVDPQFQLFRRLHYNEIPPSLSKIFGAEELLIVLPSKAKADQRSYYKELADTWSKDTTKHIKVVLDSELKSLPKESSAWIFGLDNLYAKAVKTGLKDYDANVANETIRLGKTTYKSGSNSFVISVRHPNNPAAVLLLLTIDNKDAVQGLSRKLPHYGKYSYLVFEGAEPTNIGKGEWGAVNSPLMAPVGTVKKGATKKAFTTLTRRKALATLDPVFSAERLKKTVDYLASEELAGRGPGSPGIEKAATYIIERFKSASLQPGADDGTYLQTWNEAVNEKGEKAPVKNIIGIIPGTNPAMNDQSVVVCAHYDHLGLGWPGGGKDNIGKIHPGADDNASGVSVMLELADLLGKSLKPQRTVIFVAFTSEESGRLGSKYYVDNMKRFPAKKAIGALCFDGVGRLGTKKVLVLSSNSAREWKFIFMGASYVTGVESEMVTQELDASDQRSFIDVGVPGVQFFAGAHQDYHKPSDTPDKIDATGLVKMATFAREAILYLAERETPMTFQGQVAAPESKKPAAPAGERRVSTGSMPDFAFAGPGVKIAAVSADSPAGKAGLLAGDIIMKIGTFKVTNLREYTDALKNYKPGDKVDFVYVRDGKENTASIELIAK